MIFKRGFDLILGGIIALICLVPFLALVVWIAIKRDLPLFYVSERMTRGCSPFQLIKLRTMRNVSAAQNTGVTGGDKDDPAFAPLYR